MPALCLLMLLAERELLLWGVLWTEWTVRTSFAVETLVVLAMLAVEALVVSL